MKNYYVGLDIGTDSIGWAVTDEDYRISKFKGNAMWGIRLLETSQTAEERRGYRTARRRTERNKFRKQCLEMLFDAEISKVDRSFFQRLKESNLYREDKSVGCRYSLFNDPDYTDKDYYKEYPTIYHLRKELIENKAPHDVRLVFLAVSHIIKNRGHFLFDSGFVSSSDIYDFSAVWSDLNCYLQDNYGFDMNVDSTAVIEETLKDKNLTRTKKKEKIIQFLSLNKKTDKQKIAVISLLTGLKAKPCDLFADDSLKKCEYENIEVSSGFDDNSAGYEAAFIERFELIEKIKAVYDWAVLSDILMDKRYLSFAKTEVYEKHKADLKLLKKYVKTYCKDKMSDIFIVNKKDFYNYPAYTGHCKPSPEATNCTAEKFCKFLKKTLPQKPASPEYARMYEEIADDTFMPKLASKDNSVIPVQVTRDELTAILDNACRYLDFLNDKDEKGISVRDKILSIHSFRIPYYVGPLNTHSDKAWLSRSNEKIYPWNFENVVDIEKSSERFIENLTSKCTYLPREDVLPKSSVLYSAFAVLNELNNLKVNGEKVSVDVKQKIYKDLFEKKNKVTQSGLKQYLTSILGIKDIEISGIDGDFKNNLKSFREMEAYDLSLSDKEDIIRAITIFGDDRKLLKKRIKSRYGKALSEDKVKSLCKLKYKDWGRLSRKFLTGIYGVYKESDTGEARNIIRTMWETNDNLMQILSGRYTFRENIDQENGETQFTSLEEEVEALYVSPKVKRPIYQSMQILEEIVKIQGCVPKKIFVEVARGPEDDKSRKYSRKQKLLELYESCKKEEKELYELLKKIDEAEFRKDSLYLYFTQHGRCMYTGQHIDINELYGKNVYDIDHIYPRSKIKDDSLDNRVLSLRVFNNKIKGNNYPISGDIQAKMQPFWKTLKEEGFISETKYERLVRKTSLTDDELSGFISRQLVETRQSTKAVAQLLEKRYEDTEIVYVKAGLVSDFRRDKDMFKCRDVNDLHHAKDAYLNIVVGNVYNTQFNHNRNVFIKGLQDGSKSLKKLFDYPIKGAWETEDNYSMDIVKRAMNRNNIRFTRYSSKQTGGLFDRQLLKKGKGQVPIKKNSPRSDIEKYGGYNGATSTYFSLMEYTDKKGKQVRAIIPVDLYKVKEYEANPEGYRCDLLKDAKDIKVLIPCIKYNTLISVNGFRMHISSKINGGTRCVCKPAVQLVLGYEKEKYIKAVLRYLEKCSKLNKVKEVTSFDKLSEEQNIEIYDSLTDKMCNSIFSVKFGDLGRTLSDSKESFVSLDIYNQCSVLREILTVLHANTRTGNLVKVGGKTNSGTLSISCKIEKSKKLESFKIIHQSITGLYENEIELLK